MAGAVGAAIQRIYRCLERAPPELRSDHDFMFGSVSEVGVTAFQHASDVLRSNIELIHLTCDKQASKNTPAGALSDTLRWTRQEAYDEVIQHVTPEGKVAYDAQLQKIAEQKEARLRALDSEVDLYLEKRREVREKVLREEKLARIAAGGSESDSQAEDSDEKFKHKGGAGGTMPGWQTLRAERCPVFCPSWRRRR